MTIRLPNVDDLCYTLPHGPAAGLAKLHDLLMTEDGNHQWMRATFVVETSTAICGSVGLSSGCILVACVRGGGTTLLSWTHRMLMCRDDHIKITII